MVYHLHGNGRTKLRLREGRSRDEDEVCPCKAADASPVLLGAGCALRCGLVHFVLIVTQSGVPPWHSLDEAPEPQEVQGTPEPWHPPPLPWVVPRRDRRQSGQKGSGTRA